MTDPFPRPQPAARPRPAATAAHAPAGAAGAAGVGGLGDRGRRGVLALVLAGLVLGAGLGGSLYMSTGGAAGSAPISPASPPAPAQAAASASPDSLAAGIGEALKNYQCAVSPGAGGRVMVPSDFGAYSCVIIGKTAQSQAGGGFVAPCVSAPELQDYLDAKHAGDAAGDTPSCLPSIVPSREAELRPLGCGKLSYFFSSGRKYLLCN